MTHLLLAVIYLSFISLGLPDSLLGAAWPMMYPEFQVPISFAGILAMLISFHTALSSLASDRLTRRFGAGKVTAVSVATTAAALFGFSTSHSFWALCLWAIPYGLGAGSVDAALNNYVALHYASRHMSWLHCMWGVGTSVGPHILGAVLSGGASWNAGYRSIALLQIGLTALLLLSLPLWRQQTALSKASADAVRPLSFGQLCRLPGVREATLSFFGYCALEQTVVLWASSYLVLYGGISETHAATLASLFFLGITVGRAINGFLTLKWNDTQMIHLGFGIIFCGIMTLFLPFGTSTLFAGLILIGLGCAPIYPSFIHATPNHFGAEHSQAVIGLQMASSYIGTCLMPPAFGLIARFISIRLLPVYLLGLLALMAWMQKRLLMQTAPHIPCEWEKNML